MSKRPRGGSGASQKPDRPKTRGGPRRAEPDIPLPVPWRLPILWLALAAVTLAVYQPAWQGGMLWDDDAHLTSPGLRSLAGLGRIWFDLGATQQYYPLVHSAFWLMHRLWGDATLGYHLVAILLHATSACLIVVLLTRLAIPGALVAGFAFALHPVHVESVAWMTELKNTLSTVFYLGAALSYLRFDHSRESRDWYRAAALFVLALLAKTVTATLPVALLIVFWWTRGALTWRRDVRPLVPFVAVAVVAGALTAWVEYRVIGASGAEYALGFLDRVLLAGRAVWFYLASLLWPTNLAFIYPRWTISASVWWQWLFPLALAATAALAWRLRTRTRAPLAVLLLFVVTLGPALGFLNVYPFRYSFVADHFQYAASLFVIAALAAIATVEAARRIPSAQVRAGLAVAALLPLGVLTWRGSHRYVDEETLFRSVVAGNPTGWMAHSRLSLIEVEKPVPNVEAALFHAREAARLNPNSAEVHDTVGLLLQHQGKLADARAAFALAVRLKPGLPSPHHNLGMLARAEGRLEEAVRHLSEAGRLDPANEETLQMLTRATAELGRAHEARRQAAPATGPASARLAAARALEGQGKLDEADRAYRDAVRLEPGSADVRDGLGYLLLRKGTFPEAVTHLAEAVRLRPDVGASHASLAYALREVGRLDESIAAYRRAIEFPENATRAGVRNNFGITLAMAGRVVEARAEFREALRLDPSLPGVQENLAKVEGR